MHTIHTERLIIRLAQTADAEAIYTYRSDFIENQYQGWYPGSVDEIRDYIHSMPKSPDVADVCFQFVIITGNGSNIIGDLGIIFSNHNAMQAEIGCTLHKDFQGRGYATEALQAMTDYLFKILKKHRVIASVDPRNKRSIRLIERLGFRKEGHFRKSYYLRGEWLDDIIYAMLEEDWKSVRTDIKISNPDK